MIIQKAVEITSSPKAGMTVCATGVMSCVMNIWHSMISWFGDNGALLVLFVSLLVGIATLWNQIEQAIKVHRENNKK